MCKSDFRLACRIAALPVCIAAMLITFAVSELQLSAATPLWPFYWATSLPSWIKVTCMRSAALGKVVRLLIDWLDAAYLLVFPLQQVALAQLKISPSKRQCGEQQAISSITKTWIWEPTELLTWYLTQWWIQRHSFSVALCLQLLWSGGWGLFFPLLDAVYCTCLCWFSRSFFLDLFLPCSMVLPWRWAMEILRYNVRCRSYYKPIVQIVLL